MVLFWRGWGISVLYLFVFWFLAALIYMVATTTYEPDKLKAAMDAQWLFTAMFALIALSVFAIARYRRSRPRIVIDPQTGATILVPHVDEFMFMRLDIWPYILLVVVAGFAIATLLGHPIFSPEKG